MTTGIRILRNGTEVIYQNCPDGTDISEEALILADREGEPQIFSLMQGDQELILGGTKTLRLLAKALTERAAAIEKQSK